MCLYIGKNNKIKFALKPIKCYKMVRYEDGEYLTPYYFAEISDEVISGKKNFRAKGICRKTKDPWFGGSFALEIGKGMIHTYTNIKDVYRACVGLGKCRIFECEIPRFTRYYVGSDDISAMYISKCFASKRIRFIREIDYSKANMENIIKKG